MSQEGSERVPEEGQTASFTAVPNKDLAGGYSVDNFDDQEVANASLTRLTELETELKNILEGALGKNSALSGRVDAETSLVKRSGIDALSKNSQAVMPDDDHSKSLEDYQKISREKFEEALNKEAIDAEQRKIILEQVDAIHNMRRNLLEKSLREEDQKRMDTAHGRLLGHLAHPSVTRAYINGQPASSSFLEQISKNNPPEITNPTTGSTVHYDGSALSSNDPVTLGLAIAAAGFKSATITGAPQQALLAARTALANGVQSVTFDDPTRKKILNPNAYRSWQGFIDAMTEYKAIENIGKANNSARAFKINNAFNETTESLSDITKRFNQIPSSAPGHKQFVERLTPEELATLSFELRDKSFVIGPERQLAGDKYIRYLISDRPDNAVEKANKAEFHKAYAKKVVDEALPILSKNKNAEEVAKYIGEQQHKVLREAFYNDIQNLTPFEDEQENRGYQNYVKAGLLSHLIDRVTVSKYGADGREQLGTLQHLKPEQDLILSGTTSEDRRQIEYFFNRDYDRVANKFNSLEQAMTRDAGYQVTLDNASRQDILQNELNDFLLQQERNDPEDLILNTENRLDCYHEQRSSINRQIHRLDDAADDAAQRQKMFEGGQQPARDDEISISNVEPEDYDDARTDPHL